MLPQVLLSARSDANGHQGPEPGRVGLDDRAEGHASNAQSFCDSTESVLIRSRENDCVRAFRQVARAALASCVDQLSGLNSSGEISAGHDVVAEGRKGPKSFRCRIATRRA